MVFVSHSKGCTNTFCAVCLFACFWRNSPPVRHDLIIHEVSRSHTMTHHSRLDSSGRVIISSQRPLPDNTQHPQQTDWHAPGGIRTHSLSRRAAADRRLRPRGHWDRHILYIGAQYLWVSMKLASCYRAGAQNFEVAFRFFKKFIHVVPQGS